MSNELVIVTELDKRKTLVKELSEYYYPSFKIKETINKKQEIKTFTIGTLLRLELEGVWYDIPCTGTYDFALCSKNKDKTLFNIYTKFLAEVYLTKHFYIVREDYDFKSIWQIEEKERLKEVYYD